MNISKQATEFLIDYEKKAPKVYRDSAGHLTIGIGHLLTEEELRTGKVMGSIPWRTTALTGAQMNTLFVSDLRPRERALTALLTRPATQQQFDAMFCLFYNIGVGSEKKNRPPGFTRSSVRRLFNAGDLLGAADAFLMWNKAGGKVSKGLKIRRAQERAMFLDGNYDSSH
jgi:lysozyme